MSIRSINKIENTKKNIWLVYISSIEELIECKQTIEMQKLDDKLVALGIIWEPKTSIEPSDAQLKQIEKWMNDASFLVVGVGNREYKGKMINLICQCDIRLGTKAMKIQISEETLNDKYNTSRYIKENMKGNWKVDQQEYDVHDLYNSKFINQIIDNENIEENIIRYIEQLTSVCNKIQIKYIKKCFAMYRQIGLTSNRVTLLEEELKNFCILTVEDHLTKENIE